MIQQYPTALTIAGSDSGGGAGLQADLKTMQACQTFSTNVIVGITAQNTLGVQGQYPLPKQVVTRQFASILADFHIQAVKTGALFDAEHVQMVADELQWSRLPNLTVDPVMIAKGGAHLLTPAGIRKMKSQLLPQATIVTPNLPEAELLAEQQIISEADRLSAAKKIQQLGAKNVIIKGGHGSDPLVKDYVRLANGDDFWLTAPRVKTKRTHGTGDTLSASITAFLAQGLGISTAIQRAHAYLEMIIEKPLVLGHGHGPLNHGGWSAHDEI
ncbi:bifunctional hydroxymethylpyrimidine kinase/phosphomethylpyrimidine kinase [Lactobacillus florum]|uniref:bifunctional hydroxymethylpyrimidine kinase/phosphomethylpyrimidine kinase n=1 Tax=Fructilactobacillus florum TaxID=640331 RepID=UPI00028DEEDE|nr:Phosphomethylpyrimidine kinase [Fructilactobacillus florum 2F]